MSKLFFQLMDQLTPTLRSGNLAACENSVIECLDSLPTTPFHLVAKLSITNDPIDAADRFDHFFARESARFAIAAAYTEMNGFDINPDRWYCDLFAYSEYGGHEDYDWLSDWQSEYADDYTITGLEELQAVYASDAFQKRDFTDACYICSLLVVVKFQRFMERASQHMKLLCFPLLTTAHDFDFIAEFRRAE